MINVPSGSTRLDTPFSVLLTEDCQRETEHWTNQLPLFFKRLGIEAVIAGSGQEAIEVAKRRPIHAAFVDLGTPRIPGAQPTTNDPQPGGLWLLQVLQRSDDCPPVVLVNGHAYAPSQAQRFLNEALRLGAFSVINRPVELETLLLVAQRLLDRRHAGSWPSEQES